MRASSFAKRCIIFVKGGMAPNRLNRPSPSASRKHGALASSSPHQKKGRASAKVRTRPRPCATPEKGSLAAAELPAFAFRSPRMPLSAKVALPHPGRISRGTRTVWRADEARNRAASQPGKLPAPESRTRSVKHGSVPPNENHRKHPDEVDDDTEIPFCT